MFACVFMCVCNKFVIGMEPIEWVSKKLLKHKNCLRVENYELFVKRKLPSLIFDQHFVGDIEFRNMLLSPRSNDKDGKLNYTCWSSCKLSLNNKNIKNNLSRYAIANVYIIDTIPSTILPEHEITELLVAMIASLRPFSYEISYSGGAHKSIQGNHSFFEQMFNTLVVCYKTISQQAIWTIMFIVFYVEGGLLGKKENFKTKVWSW